MFNVYAYIIKTQEWEISMNRDLYDSIVEYIIYLNT